MCGFVKHARSTGERVAIIQTFLKRLFLLAQKYYWLMFIFFIVDYVCMWGDAHLWYCGRGYNTWVYKIAINICFIKISGLKKDRLNTFPGAIYMLLHDFSDCSVDGPNDSR